jgi:WD40 repeat protein
MSGYRSLHREQIHEDEAPIWQVQAAKFSRSIDQWTLLTASADGIFRIFCVKEKQASDNLDASALTLVCTHVLLGTNQVYPPPPSQTLLGSTQCQTVRNYVGDDDMAGDFVFVSLELAGRVRVWSLKESEFDISKSEPPRHLRATHEFVVDGATGTLLKVCPPNLNGDGDLTVAVACLDGSVAIVSLGLATPKAKNEATTAGTVLDRWGMGSSTPMSLCWHPSKNVLAVGRSDGLVDIIPATRKGLHRLPHHSYPVRAVAFTPDGQLLISGSDDGYLAVWDINRQSPTLVHHVVRGHTSWILQVSTLHDSRRFVTCGADRNIHVWQLDQMHAPIHTFHCDGNVQDICGLKRGEQQRLCSGSDNGWIQIFSVD